MNLLKLDEAIQIFKKYLTHEELNDPCGLHAEHDQIWIFEDKEEISEEDKNKLDELGFFVDEDGFWTSFT